MPYSLPVFEELEGSFHVLHGPLCLDEFSVEV
jgi:hypothetical protein